MHEIAFIMGKSASGKDKIYKELIVDKELSLNTVTMYTTRPMREGEVEGVEYHFVDDEYAVSLEKQNKIIEMRSYNTVYGIWKYFTADDGQIEMSENARYIVIGTLEAYEQFCQYYGREHMLPIYIEVDDGIRLQRALTREMKQAEPKYTEMCRRFIADDKDFSEENIAKAGINKRFNNDGELDKCIDEIKKEICDKMNR